MKDRIGEVNMSNEGYEMKIVKYNKATDIIIEFQDEYKARCCVSYNNFKMGRVSNPYHKNVYDIGYKGVGNYKVSVNNKATKCYEIWIKMLQRCYAPYYINKNLTYIDCYVCDEWLCFQNFAEWFYKNYYECNNERMHLDKDILIKGNKVYSPKTCIFVPERINKLFTKRQNYRGEYPIGVTYNKNSNKLYVRCCVYEDNKNKRIFLGSFSTDKVDQAFYRYKKFKENYIKRVAEEYYQDDLIPEELYWAMYRWDVDIND